MSRCQVTAFEVLKRAIKKVEMEKKILAKSTPKKLTFKLQINGFINKHSMIRSITLQVTAA